MSADLTLSPWPLAVARRLVAGRLEAGDGAHWHPGYPLADTVDALSMVLGAHEAMGTLGSLPRWWVHEIRLQGQVVGDVGFHGPPLDGSLAGSGKAVVEIGYAVVPELRGAGIASRAVALLLDLAWRDGATQVLAETDDDNAASQAVLVRSGFRRRLSGDWALARPARGAG